jgi:hypothetical protein
MGRRTRGLSQSTDFNVRTKAPCLHLSKKVFRLSKTEGAGLEPLMEAARSFNSLDLSFEIWERDPLPLN